MMKSGIARVSALLLLSSVMATSLAGCANEKFTQGYLLDETALAKVKPGMDAQAVLQTMGSPSTVSTVGNQTWYYISEQLQTDLYFLGPKLVDRRVVAIDFNKGLRVEKVANYGIKDGAVFDFISRTTPTSGNELTLVRQVLKATGQGN